MPGSPPIRPPSPPQAGPSSSNGARASEAQPRRRFPKPPNLSDVARVHHCYVYRVVEEPPSPPAYVIPNDIGDSLSDTQLLEWSVQFARAFRTGKYLEYTFDAAGHLIIRKGARKEADESPEPIEPPAYQTPMDDRVIEALSSSLATALQSDVSIHTAIEELSSSFSTAVLADSSHPTSSEDSEMADNTHNNAFRAMDLAEYFATRAAVSIVQDISNAQRLFRGRNNGMPSPILPVARSRQYDHPPEEPQSPDENRCVFIDKLPRPTVNTPPPTTSNTVTPANSHPVSPLVTCTGADSGDSTGPARSASPETAETEEVSLNPHDQAFCVNNFEEFLDTPAAVANVNDNGNTEVLYIGRNNDMPSPVLPVARRGAHIHPPEEPRSPDENVCIIFPKQLPLPPVDQHPSTSNTLPSATTAEAVDTTPTTPIIVTPANSTPVLPLLTCTGTISGDSTASIADQPTSSSSNRVNDRSVSPSVTCTGPVDVDVTQAATDDEANTCSTQSSDVTIQLDEDVIADQTETNSPSTSDFAKPEASQPSSEKSASSGNTSDSPTVTCSEVVHATPSAVTIHSTNDSVSSSVTSTESVDATPTTSTNTTTHSVSSNLVSPSVTCTRPANTGSTPPAPSSSVPVFSSSAPAPSSLHGDVKRLNRSRPTEENAGGPAPKRHKQPAQTRINSFMEEKRKQARANQERFRISVTGKRSSARQHAMMLSQLKQIQAFMASQKTSKRARQHDETSKNEPSAKKMKAPHYHLRAYGMDELRRQAAAKRKAALTLALRKQAAEQHRCTTPTSPPFLVAPPNSPNLAPVCPPRPVQKPIKRRPLVDYESPAKKHPRKRLVDYDDTPPTSPVPTQRRPLVDYDITPPTTPAPIQRHRPLVDYESPAKKHSRKRLVDYDITPPTSPMPIQRRPLVDYQSPPPSPIPRPASPLAIVEPEPQPLPAQSPVQIHILSSPPTTPLAIENVPAPEEVPQTPPIQEEARKDIEAPKPATTSTEAQTEPVKTRVDCAVQTDPIIDAPIATQTVPAATQTPVLRNNDVETQTEPVPTANAEIQVDAPVEPIIEQPEIVPDFEPLQDDIIEPAPEDDQPVDPEEVDDAEPIIDIVQPAPEADEPEPIPEDSDDDEPEADEPEPEHIDDEEDEPNGDEPAEVDIFEPAPMDDIDISSEDDEAPVEQPIPVAQPNQRRRRRQDDDPWRNLPRVNRFVDANLPAPAPIAMNLEGESDHENDAELEDPFLQEFTPLTPTRLLQETGGDRFITGLYEGGIVTLQGRFDGVPRTSDFFARAALHPEVLYHNPADGIRQVVIGANHVAMLSESGQLYTVGRSDEGQLGRPHHRHLNPTPDNMRRHVRLRDEDGEVIEGAPEVRFERIAASGNITAAWTAAGECYACGSKHNEDLISDVFKRDPDHDDRYHIDWD